MTISSTVRVAGPFVGNGTASVFPFAFKIFAATDLDVIRLASSTGVESTLVLNSDYSVTLNGDQNSNPGGSITLLAGALASGFTLTITSDIANLQPTDLTNQGGFYPEVITDSLDRATIQIQQISDIGDRTLKIPISDGTGIDMELPPAAARANSFLSFDANGEPTVVAAGSSGAPTTITRQVFSGTGSQTVFTLASDPGALGNSAQVYIGGVYQQRSTYTIAGTTLTFSSAPVAGTGNIEFVNFLTSNIGATSADLVTYTPAGSGAVARSAASKFGDTVSVKDFGAVGDGVADDTAALRAAFQYAIPLNRPVVLRGTYRVTGSLETGTPVRSAGELHIICDGTVRINVDAASTAFAYLFWLYVDPAGSNFSVTGGSLRIDCTDKCANAFYLRHLAASTLGTISFECPVTILNCKQNAGSGDSSGITIFGNWQRVDINDVTIIGVSRTATSGVCRGITASVGTGGECTIRRPYIKNILYVAGGFDADGIGLAGPSGADPLLDFRAGRFVIESGTFIDCTGRAIKSQCSNTTVIDPYVYRKNYVGFTSSTDIDFQFGNGIVLDPVFEYRKNGGVSPLGPSHSPVVFQNKLPTANSEMASFLKDATFVSEVAMDRVVLAIYDATAISSEIVVDGITMVPANGLATTIVTDAVVEIPNVESTIVAMPGTATVRVRNVRGPIAAYLIGYDSYSGGAVASKLAIEVSNCFNTLAPTAGSSVLGNISGSRILALNSFYYCNNHNYPATLATTGANLQNFDFTQLPVGTQLTMNLDYVGTITNAPPWTTGTVRVLVEVLAAGLSVLDVAKFIRVTTFSGANAERAKVFISTDNATTWREQGASEPVIKTANFTVAASEDVIINNKSGSACVVTLPAPASWRGRRILIKTIQAQAVNSASSNVVPLAGGAAGTSIVTGTAGKYADLVSDGTNWVIMSAN